VIHYWSCSMLPVFTNASMSLKIIALLEDFTVQHVFSDKNIVMNDLAQQASGF
jgi:hypothetical protein